MRVRVRVRDHTLTINVGQGSQRLKWLAMVALQRYAEGGSPDGAILLSHAHVATGTADGDAETSPRVTPARPKRSREEPAYDETRRRQRTTQSRTAYMERGAIRRGAKRVAIEMGSWAITRVVDGRYEWRDTGLRAVDP